MAAVFLVTSFLLPHNEADHLKETGQNSALRKIECRIATLAKKGW
jgi:hypothetical protein